MYYILHKDFVFYRDLLRSSALMILQEFARRSTSPQLIGFSSPRDLFFFSARATSVSAVFGNKQRQRKQNALRIWKQKNQNYQKTGGCGFITKKKFLHTFISKSKFFWSSLDHYQIIAYFLTSEMRKLKKKRQKL